MRLALLLAGLAGGCSRGPGPAAVTPAQIPGLVAQAQQHPQAAAVRFRLAAALAAAGRCDTAVVVAQAAQVIEPDNVLGPLVAGACQEQAGRYDQAIAIYTEFAGRHPAARGVAAVHARAQLALRALAEQTARQALARETELARQPAEPQTLAVLPLVVAGDSSYQPLARGLAELITTDLAYIRTLRLLERLQIGVLLDELELSQSDRVDPQTAARVGRLLRAERMVQGTAAIPREGPMQLSASIVTGAGVVRPVGRVTGPFKQLLSFEKRVVLDLAAQLGIRLTEAERQQILRQGPRNLAAFLAYSRALEAMDRGAYAAAARHFRAAVRADPGFRAARQGQQAAQAAPIMQQAGSNPGEYIAALPEVERGAAGAPASGGLLSAGTLDVVPAAGDAISQAGGAVSGSGTLDRQLAPETTGFPSIISVVNGITIIFKRP